MRSILRNGGKALALVATFLIASVRLWPQASVQAVTDNVSYNAGDEVYVDIVFPSADAVRSLDNIRTSVRYAGESTPLLNEVTLSSLTVLTGRKHSTGYHQLWKIPLDAKTGRYEIDLLMRASDSAPAALNFPRVTSFVVHRKLVKINRVELDKSIYTSGDPIRCTVTVRNLAERPLPGLRVEFSERYWPWIAQSSERTGIDVETLVEGLSLPAKEQKEISHLRAAVARTVSRPTFQQYAVVVWDQERKTIFDIAFSSPVVVQPCGTDTPKPYPLSYVFSDLAAVDTTSYRRFTLPELKSAAIQFDRGYTMFASGAEARVEFSVRNPTDAPWHGVSIRASLQSLGSAGSVEQSVTEQVDLDPHTPWVKKEIKFALPPDKEGLFRVVIEVKDSWGQVLTSSSLELGANELPKSILIFCAHEDDEMAHAGIIRAAVENRIPIHLVYVTSGDAGSCDRYYQHSCGPDEALNFGTLRMEEARAALGHLGVPRENIYFLGLPDGGSGQIWYHHCEPTNPYLSVLLATDHAPYEGLVQPNLPHARSSVVETVKKLIERFQPEVIYTGHPDERHVDHRTNNWLVVKALQELIRKGVISPKLTLLVDQVYGPGPQTRAPYRYRKHVLHVSGEAMTRAQEAQWFHQSQSGNRALGRLRSFDQLPRTEIHWQIMDWNQHEGWNDKMEIFSH